MGKNKEWQPFSLWCKFTSFSHKLTVYLPHFQDTRGVMSLQRHGDKSLCVNRATEFYCNKSHKFSLIRFCETSCSGKILLRRQRFSQNSPVQTKKFVSAKCRSNVLLQLVCFNIIKSTHLRFWQIQSHRAL